MNFITIWESCQRDMLHLFLQSIVLCNKRVVNSSLWVWNGLREKKTYFFVYLLWIRIETTVFLFLLLSTINWKNYLEMPKFMAYTRKPHWSIVVFVVHTHYYFLFKLWTLWSKLHHISFQFNGELNINKLLRLKK